MRLYGGAWFGVGGKNEAVESSIDSPTVGGQFGLDVVGMNDVMSLGFETRIGSIKSVDGGDRSKLIDFDLKPRLRIHPEGAPIELYFTAPIGLSLPRLSAASADDANVGWNFGLGGGLNVFLHQAFGLNVEPMWLVHRFKVSGGPDIEISEFALFLNGILAI